VLGELQRRTPVTDGKVARGELAALCTLLELLLEGAVGHVVHQEERAHAQFHGCGLFSAVAGPLVARRSLHSSGCQTQQGQTEDQVTHGVPHEEDGDRWVNTTRSASPGPC
jgi:hypothetical protein